MTVLFIQQNTVVFGIQYTLTCNEDRASMAAASDIHSLKHDKIHWMVWYEWRLLFVITKGSLRYFLWSICTLGHALGHAVFYFLRETWDIRV